jgi:hypothetical protein
MLLGHNLLEFLNLRFTELFDPAAVFAHQMIVVCMPETVLVEHLSSPGVQDRHKFPGSQ